MFKGGIHNFYGLMVITPFAIKFTPSKPLSHLFTTLLQLINIIGLLFCTKYIYVKTSG